MQRLCQAKTARAVAHLTSQLVGGVGLLVKTTGKLVEVGCRKRDNNNGEGWWHEELSKVRGLDRGERMIEGKKKQENKRRRKIKDETRGEKKKKIEK